MEEDMKNNGFFRSSLFYILMLIAFVGLANFFMGDQEFGDSDQISTTEFVEYLEDGRVKNFTIQPNNGVYEITGQFNEGQEVKVENRDDFQLFSSGSGEVSGFYSTILQNDSIVGDIYELAKENDVAIRSLKEPSPSIWPSLLVTFLPFIMIIGFFYYMANQGGQGSGGGRMMNFGKSRAKKADGEKSTVRFSDVAGADEEKEELVEIVEFLKEPRRFNQLGARIPAGVLLEGPPGTGKTLLAKAVAGEAGVPFYSISGSEFVEMFVGVGASRVRDLFDEAKKNAPSIVFIDEIDAVGRQRGAGMGGGHDEREQTLNQLLVEMDGFTGNEGVIVIAATNRSDVLDPALLRPGRFDRRIMVGRPDVKGREAILKVHARNKPLADSINLKLIARQTPGFSGADLENLLNEAALVAARRKSQVIEAVDMDEAHDRVIAGPAKKDRIISEKERKMVAYHEAGHTIVGLVLSDARVVHKVTIVPRGKAGGYAIMLPKEDSYLMTKKDLTEQITGLLGGRAAEEIFFDSQSSGASNDFQQATNIARAMVTEYGMSDLLGPVQYEGGGQVFLGRDYQQSTGYSEDTSAAIDREIKRIIEESMTAAHEIINEHSDQLELIAQNLLEYETLNEIEIKSLFENGHMPSRDEKPEYPREEESEDDNDAMGTSYEEIREAQKKHLDEMEEDYREHQAHGKETKEVDGKSPESEEDVHSQEHDDIETDEKADEDHKLAGEIEVDEPTLDE